jgi:AAA+ ATPase superfamily predicted ATPase
LQKALAQPGSAMIVISGRMRVGKSRLVDEFLKKNRGLKAIIVPKEEKQVATDFSSFLKTNSTNLHHNKRGI